jgi:hypothetical protein
MLSGKVRITEYGPEENPLGYMEPAEAHPQWIIYWYQDGHAELYTKRDKSGAITGDPIMLQVAT